MPMSQRAGRRCGRKDVNADVEARICSRDLRFGLRAARSGDVVGQNSAGFRQDSIGPRKDSVGLKDTKLHRVAHRAAGAIGNTVMDQV